MISLMVVVHKVCFWAQKVVPH